MTTTELQDKLTHALDDLQAVRNDLADKSLAEKAELRSHIENSLAGIDDEATRNAVRQILDGVLAQA